LTPNPLARSSNVRYACICRTPQRCVYVMPFGSNIDVARCGWGVHTMSNSRIDKNGGATSVALIVI
ncbi:MAG: hypothetical protein K2N54_04955, partial [Helicobacter sp.]|nr:hypothetical protein [Helicobacter sp.]